MGLDQWLYARKYLSPTERFGDETNTQYYEVLQSLGKPAWATDVMPSIYIEIKVCQWRKANQIHKWFVDNCQGGEDDCREAFVRREQLEELIAVCQEALNKKQDADQLLPTQEGFFFGGNEYDTWYFQDLQDTVDNLSVLVKDVPDEYEFAYASSW